MNLCWKMNKIYNETIFLLLYVEYKSYQNTCIERQKMGNITNINMKNIEDTAKYGTWYNQEDWSVILVFRICFPISIIYFIIMSVWNFVFIFET